MKLSDEYRELRYEFLKRFVRSRGRVAVDHFYGKIDMLVRLKYGAGKNNIDRYKKIIKDRLDLPFRPQNYPLLKRVKVIEISWESGVSAMHVLGSYLRNARWLYVASPFIGIEDIKHIHECTSSILEDFRIITSRSKDCYEKLKREAAMYSCDVRFLDIHAKMMVTNQVCVVGSMNFNEYGFSRAITHELILLVEDQKFVRDRAKQFLWWWELARDIERVLEERIEK